ncbi:hypothetical protein Shyhy01_43270 [Streptomyces hygroscopicus subsp. hygroscopicus]|nr:hypothetical protein Shyhy01_43270 [Streptomyces hygroscopicus subsp. hygroscopicus]
MAASKNRSAGVPSLMRCPFAAVRVADHGAVWTRVVSIRPGVLVERPVPDAPRGRGAESIRGCAAGA